MDKVIITNDKKKYGFLCENINAKIINNTSFNKKDRYFYIRLRDERELDKLNVAACICQLVQDYGVDLALHKLKQKTRTNEDSGKYLTYETISRLYTAIYIYISVVDLIDIEKILKVFYEDNKKMILADVQKSVENDI